MLLLLFLFFTLGSEDPKGLILRVKTLLLLLLSLLYIIITAIGDFHIICKLAASVGQKCKQLLFIDIVICKN